MSKNILFVLLIASILVISGCVTGGDVKTGNGVIIEAFRTSPTDPYSGEEVLFEALVRNTGSVDAVGLDVEILNLDENNWKLTQKTDKYKLIPPDIERGTQGGSKVIQWSLKAPDLPKGLKLVFTPTVRATYYYSTTTIKAITLLSLADARRLADNPNAKVPIDAESSTRSPISLDITTKGPIRVFENNIEFPLEIIISNVGGGTVSKTKDSKEWNKIEYKIIPPSGIKLLQCETKETITLFKGETNTITCLAQVDKPPTAPIQKLIEVSAIYYYFVEDSLPLTVTGTK